MTERGKAAVTAAAVAQAAREVADIHGAAEAEQLDLLPVRTRFHDRRADAVRATVAREGAVGRPRGAQNLGTEEWRKFLFQRGVSPLVAMMRYAIMPPDVLAQELGCTKLEAFDRWKDLQAELAKYMHQQMPRAIEVDGATAGVLILGDITPERRAELAEKFGPAMLTLSPGEYEEKQAVSEPEVPPSHGERRTEEPK